MQLDLTDEQSFFAETTRKFLAEKCSTAHVRGLEDSPVGFDRATWRAGCELGWTSLLVPEADGGGSLSEHGLLDALLVAEEFGRTVAPGPLVPCNVVAFALATGGTAEQKAEWLPGLTNGDVIGAWVTQNGGIVEAGAQADVFVVSTPDGVRLAAADTPGVEVTPAESLDLVRRFATVTIPDGAGTQLAVQSEQLLQIALTLQSAETCGAIDHIFAMTLEYMDHRYSFGRPISSYQALKHRMADNKTLLEACHGISDAAARAVATGAANANELLFAASSFIGDTATNLIQDCLQLHGGIGVTWEHDIHLYLRRATVNRVMYATSAESRERIASILLGAA